jgi:hypothetical protein
MEESRRIHNLSPRSNATMPSATRAESPPPAKSSASIRDDLDRDGFVIIPSAHALDVASLRKACHHITVRAVRRLNFALC